MESSGILFYSRHPTFCRVISGNIPSAIPAIYVVRMARRFHLVNDLLVSGILGRTEMGTGGTMSAAASTDGVGRILRPYYRILVMAEEESISVTFAHLAQ